MSRARKAVWAAAAGIIAVVLTLGLSVPASATVLPSCQGGVNCASNASGEAGYYGADDNHTHYKYVQTVVVATPQLVNLNGASNTDGGGPGAVGAELCNPNISPNGFGTVAQVGLWWNGHAFVVSYGVGNFTMLATDPCIQDGFAVKPLTSALQILSAIPISAGDKIFLSVSYQLAGHHQYQFQFSACDTTAPRQVCRQAYSSTWRTNLDEFGIGAITNNVNLTAPANNYLDTFSYNDVQCYSCASMVPITSVAPVNPFGIGGLSEAQFQNVSSQITLSPNDSLTLPPGDSFNIWNGSTTP